MSVQATCLRSAMARILGGTAIVLVAIVIAGVVQAQAWRPIANDGLHDPEAPATAILQEPAEALSRLPQDTAGNRVDWVRALQDGYIEPRTSLDGNKEKEVLDLDVIMTGGGDGSMPYVRFPHKPHTQWLECGNCHEALFRSEAGATPVSMLAILDGEYCGRCHGAVSFPLTECNRCHSVPQDSVTRTTGSAPSANGTTGQ